MHDRSQTVFLSPVHLSVQHAPKFENRRCRLCRNEGPPQRFVLGIPRRWYRKVHRDGNQDRDLHDKCRGVRPKDNLFLADQDGTKAEAKGKTDCSFATNYSELEILDCPTPETLRPCCSQSGMANPRRQPNLQV